MADQRALMVVTANVSSGSGADLITDD